MLGVGWAAEDRLAFLFFLGAWADLTKGYVLSCPILCCPPSSAMLGTMNEGAGARAHIQQLDSRGRIDKSIYCHGGMGGC